MTIDWFHTKSGEEISFHEVIKRLRRMMIVHSYLYYRMDAPVISDDAWQDIANDLAEIQQMYPEPIGYFDELFADWTGDTGMHVCRLDDNYWYPECLYISRCFQSRKAND